MLIIFFRAIILYALVIFAIRLMGKRQLGELQPSELVITILVSNIATLPIEDINLPMTTGIIPILTLVCVDVIMSAVTLKSRKFRRIICGSPKVIISDGKIDQTQLDRLRMSNDDLLAALRGQDIFDISQVQFAIMETTGSISVMKKQSQDNLTPQDLEIQKQDIDPPIVVIERGKIITSNTDFLQLKPEEIAKICRHNKCEPSEVFLMTLDKLGNSIIIKDNHSSKIKK